ncbi:cytokinin-o-glucosyltransferase 2 [Hordeum vulgare]|nr:cytokinin-o-glucosyltransferase 2 [Hordeum vulgare]
MTPPPSGAALAGANPSRYGSPPSPHFASVFVAPVKACSVPSDGFAGGSSASGYATLMFVVATEELNDSKKIRFTRNMVKKIFNVPSSSKPLEFVKRGKADFCEVYLDGERAPIPTIVYVLSNASDEDDDTLDRSWILLCLSLVLAPRTGNMVPMDYLYNLQDMSVVHEFEWDEHILFDVMREVKIH